MLIIAPGNNMILDKLLSSLGTDDIKVFNLCSFNESIQRVDIIPPLDLLKNGNVENIDFILSDYIFNNDAIFFEFMVKVIIPLYSQQIVILLGNIEYDFYDICIESLLKIIQTRYGISGVIINDLSDIDMVSKNLLFGRDSEFTIQGLMNLDIDKDRYSNIFSTISNIDLEAYDGI